MGSWCFTIYTDYSFYPDYELLYWVIFTTAFLLGEGGIFLLYTIKPLEKKVLKIIYTIIYMTIHVAGIIILWDVFLFHLFVFF